MQRDRRLADGIAEELRSMRARNYIQWPQFVLTEESLNFMQNFGISREDLEREIDRQMLPVRDHVLDEVVQYVIANWDLTHLSPSQKADWRSHGHHWTALEGFEDAGMIRAMLLHKITVEEVDAEIWNRGYEPINWEDLAPENRPPPPRFYGGPGFQPAGVPRKPLPYSGGSEIALPLPEPPEETES